MKSVILLTFLSIILIAGCSFKYGAGNIRHRHQTMCPNINKNYFYYIQGTRPFREQPRNKQSY
jgi:hypothetical protein